MRLRPDTTADFPAVLALNEGSVHFLSALSPARLETLHAQSSLHAVVEDEGQVIAFLLAFREGSAYDSVNYRWFVERYPRFLYIDRVVVSEAARARGVGALLYRHVFEHAAAQGIPWVTCEFDIEPPNPASERFHAKFGFGEVGRRRVPYAPKLVSLRASNQHVAQPSAAPPP